jgi:hypothetical protein
MPAPPLNPREQRFPDNPPPNPDPGPGDKKEKPPNKDPEPQKQPPNQEPQDHSGPMGGNELVSVYSPFSLSLNGDPTFHSTASLLVKNDWFANGSFEALGKLGSGNDCCVAGDLRSIQFDRANGFQVSCSVGSWDFGIAGYQSISGKAKTSVTVCSPGVPDIIEKAEVDVEISWLMALSIRGTLLESRLGPLTANTGLAIGALWSSVDVQGGTSVSSQFSIDETHQSIAGVGGAFIGLGLTLGKFQARAIVDYIPRGVSNAESPKNLTTLSFGIGIGF